jgi:hypothetical protein
MHMLQMQHAVVHSYTTLTLLKLLQRQSTLQASSTYNLEQGSFAHFVLLCSSQTCMMLCFLTWPVTGDSTDSKVQHTCCALLLLRPTAACHQSTNSRTACSNSAAVSWPVAAAQAIGVAGADALVVLLAGLLLWYSCGLALLLSLQVDCEWQPRMHL